MNDEPFDVDAALDKLAQQRADDLVRAGLPATLADVVGLLVRNTKNGKPSRSHEVMTPSRYTLAADLLRAGVKVELVIGAVNRINASAWLRKPVDEVTDDDLVRARKIAEEAGAA